MFTRLRTCLLATTGSIALVGLAAFGGAGAATAAAAADPHLGLAFYTSASDSTAHWVLSHGETGDNFSVLLQTTSPTEGAAYAVAALTGIQGLTLNQLPHLGFDAEVAANTHGSPAFGAGAPRVSVILSGGPTLYAAPGHCTDLASTPLDTYAHFDVVTDSTCKVYTSSGSASYTWTQVLANWGNSSIQSIAVVQDDTPATVYVGKIFVGDATVSAPDGARIAAVESSNDGVWAQVSTVDPPGSYRNMSGVLLYPPTVVGVASQYGTALFFAISTNHLLYVRNLYSGWQQFVHSGYCIDTPGAVVTGTTVTAACVGGNHAVYYAQAQLGSGLPVAPGWNPLGGGASAGPALAAPGGVITFFVLGGIGGHDVFSRTLSTGYRHLPGYCSSHPGAANDGASQAVFACRGPHDNLWYALATSSSIGGYTNLAGNLYNGVGVAGTNAGPEFFVQGPNHNLWERGLSSAWSNDSGYLVDGASAAALS